VGFLSGWKTYFGSPQGWAILVGLLLTFVVHLKQQKVHHLAASFRCVWVHSTYIDCIFLPVNCTICELLVMVELSSYSLNWLYKLEWNEIVNPFFQYMRG